MAQLLRQRSPVDALHTTAGAALDGPRPAPIEAPPEASPAVAQAVPRETPGEVETARAGAAGARLRLVAPRPRRASGEAPAAAAPWAVRVRVAHDLGSVAAAWDELAGRLAAPPFLRPGWTTCWWEAFGRGALEIHLLERGGRLAALVPLVRRRGALLAAMNCHTPELGLLAEDPAAAAALGRAVFAAAPHRVWIAALDPDGAALAAVRRGAREAGYRVVVRPYQTSPYLPIEGGWGAYRAGLSANLADDLRRSRRRLARQGEVAVEVADGRERLDALLAEAFEVEASGWKGRRGTAIRSRPATRRFYTGVARWAAGEGMLRLFFLRLDGRPIAMLYALETAGVCHLLKGGYDPAFGRSSPGKLLLDAALRHGFETGLGRIELHGDAEPYKLRWTGAVVERQLFEAFSRSPAGRLSWAVRGWGRRAARRLLGRPGAAGRPAAGGTHRPTQPEVTR